MKRKKQADTVIDLNAFRRKQNLDAFARHQARKKASRKAAREARSRYAKVLPLPGRFLFPVVNPVAPRESWLAGLNPHRFAAAMSVCDNPSGECAYTGQCSYGDCFPQVIEFSSQKR